MLNKSIQANLALLTSVLLVQSAFGQCPQGTPPTGGPTSYTATETSAANGGTYYNYYNDNGGSANETGSTYLPILFGLPGYTGSGATASFGTNHGAFSNPSTYPSGGGGVMWALNNSSSVNATTNTTCTPGVNCDACEATSGYDCTNRPVSRWPATGLKSTNFGSLGGFRFTGYFEGEATVATLPAGMKASTYPAIAAAYFHQSPVYLGGIEFGFYSEYSSSGPGSVNFYFSDNSNCSDIYGSGAGNNICDSATEGGSPAGTGNQGQTGFTACALENSGTPLNPTSSETYTVYLVYNSTTGWYEFAITAANAGVSWVVDPTTSGLYISTSTLGGYVTTGIQRFDPSNNQTYNASNAPYFYVSGLSIGN